MSTDEGGFIDAGSLRVAEAKKAHARGWALMPLVGKRPYAANWPSAPFPALEEVEEAARRGNVGLRTGRVSRIVVVDDDTPDGSGARALNLPPTVQATTGSGKDHYYFNYPEEGVGNSVGRVAPNVDIRGDGGQVVFVGSIHPDTGRAYVWAPGRSPDEIGLADLPAKLLDAARSARPLTEPRSAESEDPIKATVAIDHGIELLGLRVEGGNVQCPDHDDRDKHPGGDAHPSAARYEDHLYCFKCNESFDIYALVMRAKSCSFPDAKAHLQQVAGLSKDRQSRERDDVLSSSLVSSANRSLPQFPIDALPETIARFVHEASESIQVEADVPGLFALTVMAATGAGKISVAVGTTHEEPLSLWTVSVLNSGERKTAIYKEMLVPLEAWEKQELREYSAHLRAAKERVQLHEETLKARRSKAAKEEDPRKRDELEREIDRLAREAPEIPESPGLLAQDITPEALARKLAHQGGRALVSSDEGGIFSLLAGRYSSKSAPNLDVFLKAHAGSQIKVERVGRAPDIVDHAVLCMGLAVQPHILESFSDTAAFRGTGLLARFLFSLPQSRVGTRRYTGRPIAPSIRAEYRRIVMEALRCQRNQDDSPPSVVKIDGDALERWRLFHDEVELECKPGGRFEAITDWASKIAGAVARIAGAIHLIERLGSQPTEPAIPASVVDRAVRIGRYLCEHALAAFREIGMTQTQRLAIKILRWLRRKRVEEFSMRELRQDLRSGTASQQEHVFQALSMLEDGGQLERLPEVKKDGPGRRPSPRWRARESAAGTTPSRIEAMPASSEACVSHAERGSAKAANDNDAQITPATPPLTNDNNDGRGSVSEPPPTAGSVVLPPSAASSSDALADALSKRLREAGSKDADAGGGRHA